MEFLSREQIINELQDSFQPFIDKYGIEDIGVFEEEGENDHYYLGYTIRKDGKAYHIHSPYLKNNAGGLTPEKKEWILESDDPNKVDVKGSDNIEDILRKI